MKKIDYPALDETFYYGQIDSGLSYVIVPKTMYSSVYSSLVVPIGSFTTKYYKDEQLVDLPLGTAHFLEHQLFDNEEEGSIIKKFAALGADANAYTGAFETVYLAESSKNHLEVIRLLLNYVQNPKFTSQTVEKEKGIIIQELMMYLDNPAYVLEKGLMNILYKAHPIKNHGLGTKESILSITYEDLMKAFNDFYQAPKMLLIVVGNIEVHEVVEVLNSTKISKIVSPLIKAFNWEESLIPNIKFSSEKADIIIPKVAVGLKIPSLDSLDCNLLKTRILMSIFIQHFLASSSEFGTNLLDEGLYSTNYAISVNSYPNCAYLVISADSHVPEQFYQYIYDNIENLKSKSITDDEFTSKFNGFKGSIIKSLNNLENYNDIFVEKHILNYDFFANYAELGHLHKNDLNVFFTFLKKENLARYIVYPKENDFFQNSDKNN